MRAKAVEVENEPAGQAVQVEGAAAPTKVLYVPAPQRVQVALEAAPVADDQVPAGQGVHVEGAVAPRMALYVPAPQLVQTAMEAAPAALDHVPAGQGMAAPLIALCGQKNPGGQNIAQLWQEAQLLTQYHPGDEKQAGGHVVKEFASLSASRSVTPISLTTHLGTGSRQGLRN